MINVYFQLVILVVAIAINIALALIVLNNNSRSASNRIFGLLSITISIWVLVNYLAIRPNMSAQTTLLLERLTIIFAAPMSALFFLLAHTLPKSTLRLSLGKLRAVIAGTLVMMLINMSPLAFSGPVYKNGSYSPIPGPGLAFFSILSIYFSVGAVYFLWRNLKHAVSTERDKLRYVLAGISVMLALIIVTVFIPVVIFKSTFFVAFAPLYTLAFLGLTTYAIVRHRLFDIRALVAKSVAYILLLPTVAILYAAGIFGISAFFFPASTQALPEKSTYVLLAVVLAFTFQPMRRFFEKITDGIFFRDRYESQVVLSNVTTVLASELHLEIILRQSLNEVCRRLRISGGQFVVFEKNEVYFQMHSGPLLWGKLTVEDTKLLDRGVIVTDELEAGIRKDLLMRHHIRVSLLLRTKDERVGYLFLGDKLSGDTYSDQDLNLLEILRKELAVAIVNAKAYEEIANFNATLQERIQKATRHLSLANKKLKVLDKTKDDFISMASHQLGTPLTAVTGYLSMTLDEDRGNMSVAQREYVTIALESSERLVNMAGDLLNVSRLNAGRFNIMAQPIDLVPLIEQEMLQLRSSAERKNLELSFTPPQEAIPQVSIDESKTRQVIMNFIDNAIYYTQKGSIKVTLEKAGDEAVFKVVDTGMGVPPAEQAKLFAKFYRADNAKAARPDGTGLGLYLAKRVIEDQGGEIIFESQFGAGSTFGFKLPFAKSAAKPAEQPAYR